MAFDGTHIHIGDNADEQCSDDSPAVSEMVQAAYRLYLYCERGRFSPTGMTFDGTHIHHWGYN